MFDLFKQLPNEYIRCQYQMQSMRYSEPASPMSAAPSTLHMAPGTSDMSATSSTAVTWRFDPDLQLSQELPNTPNTPKTEPQIPKAEASLPATPWSPPPQRSPVWPGKFVNRFLDTNEVEDNPTQAQIADKAEEAYVDEQIEYHLQKPTDHVHLKKRPARADVVDHRHHGIKKRPASAGAVSA